jgi:hypothetical protein
VHACWSRRAHDNGNQRQATVTIWHYTPAGDRLASFFHRADSVVHNDHPAGMVAEAG